MRLDTSTNWDHRLAWPRAWPIWIRLILLLSLQTTAVLAQSGLNESLRSSQECVSNASSCRFTSTIANHTVWLNTIVRISVNSTRGCIELFRIRQRNGNELDLTPSIVRHGDHYTVTFVVNVTRTFTGASLEVYTFNSTNGGIQVCSNPFNLHPQESSGTVSNISCDAGCEQLYCRWTPPPLPHPLTVNYTYRFTLDNVVKEKGDTLFPNLSANWTNLCPNQDYILSVFTLSPLGVGHQNNDTISTPLESRITTNFNIELVNSSIMGSFSSYKLERDVSSHKHGLIVVSQQAKLLVIATVLNHSCPPTELILSRLTCSANETRTVSVLHEASHHTAVIDEIMAGKTDCEIVGHWSSTAGLTTPVKHNFRTTDVQSFKGWAVGSAIQFKCYFTEGSMATGCLVTVTSGQDEFVTNATAERSPNNRESATSRTASLHQGVYTLLCFAVLENDSLQDEYLNKTVTIVPTTPSLTTSPTHSPIPPANPAFYGFFAIGFIAVLLLIPVIVLLVVFCYKRSSRQKEAVGHFEERTGINRFVQQRSVASPYDEDCLSSYGTVDFSSSESINSLNTPPIHSNQLNSPPASSSSSLSESNPLRSSESNSFLPNSTSLSPYSFETGLEHMNGTTFRSTEQHSTIPQHSEEHEEPSAIQPLNSTHSLARPDENLALTVPSSETHSVESTTDSMHPLVQSSTFTDQKRRKKQSINKVLEHKSASDPSQPPLPGQVTSDEGHVITIASKNPPKKYDLDGEPFYQESTEAQN